ncbi:hypothetical protein [Borreliella afzelii]|uniref:hypothetical protein n=1 Tax=Borreliella afzelii TaxID=29518 RepID=UPI003AF5D1E0
MELAPHHKQIIWEYLVAMLEEKLESKMIVGDFDEDIKNAVFDTKKYCKPLQSSSHDTNILYLNILMSLAQCRVTRRRLLLIKLI